MYYFQFLYIRIILKWIYIMETHTCMGQPICRVFTLTMIYAYPYSTSGAMHTSWVWALISMYTVEWYFVQLIKCSLYLTYMSVDKWQVHVEWPVILLGFYWWLPNCFQWIHMISTFKLHKLMSWTNNELTAKKVSASTGNVIHFHNYAVLTYIGTYVY